MVLFITIPATLHCHYRVGILHHILPVIILNLLYSISVQFIMIPVCVFMNVSSLLTSLLHFILRSLGNGTFQKIRLCI